MAFSTTYGTGAFTTDVDGNTRCQYETAFRVISDTGSSVKLTDILSPLDKRTTIKYVLSKIADVYKTLGGDSVPVSERSSNPTGQTLFTELTTILTRPNPAVSNSIIQVPVQARIELRLPNDGQLADADVNDLIEKLISTLTDTDGSPRVCSELLRGALVPAGI